MLYSLRGCPRKLCKQGCEVDHVRCAQHGRNNAEAAATPPPQLPTQDASKFPSSSLFFCFFFKFVREVGVGHHSQEDLAKFGYRSERKVKKF
jgi:hypothetical protein